MRRAPREREQLSRDQAVVRHLISELLYAKLARSPPPPTTETLIRGQMAHRHQGPRGDSVPDLSARLRVQLSIREKNVCPFSG